MSYDLAAMAKRAGENRSTITLRAIFPTKALAQDLARLYMRVVRAWRDAAQELILPAYSRALAELTNDSFTRDDIPDIEAEIARSEAQAYAVIASLTIAIDAWAEQTQKWHADKFAANVAAGTSIDVELLMSSDAVRDTLRAFLAENTNLISSISQETKTRIAGIVWRGYLARTPRREIAREINKAIGMARDRALRIASDQTVKLAAKLDELRQREAGFEEFEWAHSGKVRYRPEHKARNGKVYKWTSSVAKNDPPGYAINCFPSDQPVAFHDDALVLWRRWHHGEATEIITDSGITVRCTPNHPILTRTGWKAAHLINVGDNLVDHSDSGILSGDMDVEKTQPRFGDLFEAAKAIFGSVSVNGGGADFHGDALVNEKIEVVDTKGGLRHHLASLADEDLVQVLLKYANASEPTALHRLRSTQFFEISSGLTAPRVVSWLDHVEALLWRHFGPLEPRSISVPSNIDAVLFEAGNESWARHANSVRYGIGALATLVGPNGLHNIEVLSVVCAARDRLDVKAAPHFQVFAKNVRGVPILGGDGTQRQAAGNLRDHRVKSVVTRAWFGHVHNLETVSGWYSVGRIPAKNCGCKAKPVLRLD